MRRFTRLTNAFSKKMENHVHALSIYFMHHNFIRIVPKRRVTPAMAAKVTDKLWSMEDVVALVEAAEPTPAKRGPYRKRSASLSDEGQLAQHPVRQLGKGTSPRSLRG